MSATEVLLGDSVQRSTDPGATQMSTCALSGAQGSPWGGVKVQPWCSPGVAAAPACSLEDVMSEELVKQLQQEELHKEGEARVTEPVADMTQLLDFGEGEVSSDLLLAQMLQHEFDREHDSLLQIEENHVNKASRVKVSFENFRSVHPSLTDDNDDSDDSGDWEDSAGPTDVTPKFKKTGITGKGKNIVTKHDATICGRKNTARVMENFPPEFEMGDGSNFDMKLSNRVYNELKLHCVADSKRSRRLHEKKEHSTAVSAVDAKTRLILYKLVNQELLESVNGVISTGKESVVFHAVGGSKVLTAKDGTELGTVPKECAIKVFKTTLTDFKNRALYVKGDARFFKDEFKKQNPRRIMKIWAEKEEANLRRMQRHGIPCPSVVILRKHVLVMSFIGSDQCPATQLKEARLSTVDAQLAYEQCIENMKKMHRECLLVHADLSEYNMLWDSQSSTLYFIDVSQAVDVMHPHAMEFLLRDCTNVVNFFTRAGVVDVPQPCELFNEITGLGLTGEGPELLMQIEEYEKNEEHLRSGQGRDYAFEFFFERAQAEHKTKSHDRDNESLTQCDTPAVELDKEDVSFSSDMIQTYDS